MYAGKVQNVLLDFSRNREKKLEPLVFLHIYLKQMIYNDRNDRFQQWLRKKGFTANSVSKYSTQSHNRILKDLGISFYEFDSLEKLNQLLFDVRELV